MKDDLKLFKNGKRPKICQKWMTTSYLKKNGRCPQFFLENGRQSKYFSKGKIKSIFWQMEDKKIKTFLGLAKLSKILLFVFFKLGASVIVY